MGYEKWTSSKRTGSGPAGSATGSTGSGSDWIPSSHAKLRDAAAVARCARLMIQPSASSGHTSCSRRVMNSVNWPIVRFPAIASRPPTKRTAAIPIVGRNTSPGRKRASTDAWRMVSWRTASARSWKRSRTSSSRPNACTISIPTTASSDASVRCPFFRCTSREMGKTRCAKK